MQNNTLQNFPHFSSLFFATFSVTFHAFSVYSKKVFTYKVFTYTARFIFILTALCKTTQPQPHTLIMPSYPNNAGHPNMKRKSNTVDEPEEKERKRSLRWVEDAMKQLQSSHKTVQTAHQQLYECKLREEKVKELFFS